MTYRVKIEKASSNDLLFEQLFECLDVGQVVIWLNTHKSLASPVVPAPIPVVVAITPPDEDVPF